MGHDFFDNLATNALAYRQIPRVNPVVLIFLEALNDSILEIKVDENLLFTPPFCPTAKCNQPPNTKFISKLPYWLGL